MPRLLLVDDNPSIHRIAESLLAPTDVELVCVASAAEALDRLGRGERFDVALVDTAMPGMDGWTLLDRLRAMEETARMPIALMAGVLDPVDPAKLAKAPIQGFLKKPIELRELGDRVKALLNTPVVAPASSPFSTVPATPAGDLLQRPEMVLPEYRPDPVQADADSLVFDEDFLTEEEDLLVLNAGDLWPEEPVLSAPEPVAPEVAEEPIPSPVLATLDVSLELEELDLDSLQDLTEEPLPAFEPEAASEPEAATPVQASQADVLTLESDEDLFPESTLDLGSLEITPEEDHLTMSGLEALDSFPADFDMPLPPVPPPTPEPVAESVDFAMSASVAGAAVAGVAVGLATLPDHEAPPAPEPAVDPAAVGQVSAVPGQAVGSEQAQVLVQALLADPVLVDALVKAVVARMGDQVLREIAWEVMPDLAGRLQR